MGQNTTTKTVQIPFGHKANDHLTLLVTVTVTVTDGKHLKVSRNTMFSKIIPPNTCGLLCRFVWLRIKRPPSHIYTKSSPKSMQQKKRCRMYPTVNQSSPTQNLDYQENSQKFGSTTTTKKKMGEPTHRDLHYKMRFSCSWQKLGSVTWMDFMCLFYADCFVFGKMPTNPNGDGVWAMV